jgi:carotenoid cleavage dioxygenase
MNNVAATVIGTIPADLSGEYLRNGPNQNHPPTGRMHMFDGEGMIHQVRITEGEAFYSNTYIRTPKFKINARNGRDSFTHVGDLAGGGGVGMAKIVCELLKKRLGMLPKLSRLESSSGSTSLLFHHNKLYALQEIAYPFALDVDLSDKDAILLSGEGTFERFDGKLTAPFSAHVKIDPDSQDMIFFSNSIDSGHIFYAELSREGELKTFRPIQKDNPCIGFLHDSFVTEHFAICPDMSIRFDVTKMRSEHKSPWFFDANTSMTFGVVRRKPDKNGHTSHTVQWFDTGKPGFIWHTINGWEERRPDGGTDLLLFAPVFDDYPSTIPIHLPEEPEANVWLWRLNLESGEITEQRALIDQFFERPSINEKYLGKKHRFAYLLDKTHPRRTLGCGVQKYDLIEERLLEHYSYGDDFGGEPIFVAKSDAQAEDDGYILELLMNEREASLIILDARDLSLHATIKLPQRIPFGVHSLWIPQKLCHTLESDRAV